MNTKENFENAFSIAENSTERLWEAFLVTMGSMSWTQEQTDNLFRKYLDGNKTAREEGSRLMEEVVSQAKKNQQQIQKMIEEAVVGAFGNLDIPTFSYIEELSKKVDELSKKVDNL